MSDSDLTVSQDEFLVLRGNDAGNLIVKRFEALRELGCDAEAAVVVAMHPEISVSEAADLIERGCDPRTVLRVLR